MKQLIIEIDNCTECPFCKYTDQYDGYRAEDLGQKIRKEGFYCTKMHPYKYISNSYNINGNIDIPNWCKLKDI